MKICVVHPKICTKSAKALAFELNADRYNLSTEDKFDFSDYDLVFNYGSSKYMNYNAIINNPMAVENCINKIRTFRIFDNHNIPTVKWITHKDFIPNNWDIIVCRSSAIGNQAKEIEYFSDREKISECPLYTEYYHHEFELRIIVFKGKVVGRYVKEQVGDNWHFQEVKALGMKKIDRTCIKAAKVLDIDYVGFDILSNDCEDFVILEANSGSTITEEVLNKIRINILGE